MSGRSWQGTVCWTWVESHPVRDLASISAYWCQLHRSLFRCANMAEILTIPSVLFRLLILLFGGPRTMSFSKGTTVLIYWSR